MTRHLRDPRVQVTTGPYHSPIIRWTENLIDWRASRGRADRRLEKGETPDVCVVCECELDVVLVMHRPGCAGNGVAA